MRLAMSRLDSFIRRMQAQRDCLNHIAAAVRSRQGPILEVGLGNGRTYDHLRELFPGREIFVFDRVVVAHPACIPPFDRLLLGEARDTLRQFAQRFGRTAALIHCDLGTGERSESETLDAWLAPALDALLAPDALAVINRPLAIERWRRLPDPPGVPRDRYFIYTPIC
jgi:hypothetical protein